MLHIILIKICSNFVDSQISTNGVILLGHNTTKTFEGFPLTDESHGAAPYWSDVDTLIDGEIWFSHTSQSPLLLRATRDVRRVFPVYRDFSAKWVFVVTWDRVAYFGSSGPHRHRVRTEKCERKKGRTEGRKKERKKEREKERKKDRQTDRQKG